MRRKLARWLRLGRRRRTFGLPPAAAADPEVEAFLLWMPKVEIQVPLEACLRPARILSLMAKHGLELPFESEADVRKLLRFSTFGQRAKVRELLGRTLRDAEDVHLLALDFVAEQAMQNVRYSEVHVDVAAYLRRGIDGEDLRRALAEAAADGRRRHGIRLRTIATIDRAAGPEVAEQVLEWALADADGLVAGVDLGGRGSEPSDVYRSCFERASAAGLGLAATVDQGGPDEIREVLAGCGPERLGSGSRAAEDPALVAELAERGTALLLCPSADVRCGLYPDLGEHPLAALRRAGAAVSVHTGGGPLHDTNLVREYVRLHLAQELSVSQLGELAAAAAGPAFLAAADQAALAAELEEGVAGSARAVQQTSAG